MFLVVGTFHIKTAQTIKKHAFHAKHIFFLKNYAIYEIIPKNMAEVYSICMMDN
jgi:hypothetical protein